MIVRSSLGAGGDGRLAIMVGWLDTSKTRFLDMIVGSSRESGPIAMSGPSGATASGWLGSGVGLAVERLRINPVSMVIACLSVSRSINHSTTKYTSAPTMTDVSSVMDWAHVAVR